MYYAFMMSYSSSLFDRRSYRVRAIHAVAALMIASLATTPLQSNVIQKTEVVINSVDATKPDGGAEVVLTLLNRENTAQTADLPLKIDATIEMGNDILPATLERMPDTAASVSIPPHQFAFARYRLHLPEISRPVGRGLLSIPAWGTQSVAFSTPAPSSDLSTTSPASKDIASTNTHAHGDNLRGKDFLDHLSIFDPMYVVYGPGTNTAMQMQISYKYQLFGHWDEDGEAQSWLEGLHLGYTQRMFWDLENRSSPIRNIDFMPELLYLTPTKRLSETVTLNGQIGVRHESNGERGALSRSLSLAYIQPTMSVNLGSEIKLKVGPRFWEFLGNLPAGNRDIRHYRGNTGLFVEIGQDDGLRLSTNSRLNFGSGKGAISADISYPLYRIFKSGLHFYLYGQSFNGYGESLVDYNKRVSRFRIGIAFVR